MTDNAKLSISLVVIFVLDLLFIYAGYVHGKMHLLNTLKAAVAAWN